ncbi:hypothetical protein [Paenibacillus cisolokensis]|nr:hypothetical protein [Paenibacillus cisolokensis]
MKRASLTQLLEFGRELKRIKDAGLADHIGGFGEFIALVGLSRQQADRLVRLAEVAAR